MKQLIAIIMLVILLAFVCAPAQADDQGYPTTTTSLTLSSGTVAASGTATITSGSFTVNGLTGFAVTPTFALAAAGTTNVTFNFQASADGTTWSTNYPFSAVIAATGTTPVVNYVNFPPNVTGTGCANARYVRLGQVINSGTSTLTISGVKVTKSNR